jgi:23S rRNA pseudouridine1911/1915/1917 synthase
MAATKKTSSHSASKGLSHDGITGMVQVDEGEEFDEVDVTQVGQSVAPQNLSFTGPVALSVVRDMRLDAALAQLIPDESRSRLVQMIKAGHVLLDGAPAQSKHKISGFERIDVCLQPRPEQHAFVAEKMDLSVLFEDDHVLVLDKPAGLVVHPGSGNWSGTLLNGLLAHHKGAAALPRAGIVHRLDKDTTGVMVVAKTIAAYHNLVEQLAARSVRRTYWAVVRGHLLNQQVIDAPIGRHPRERTRMSVLPTGSVGAREAITLVMPVEYFHKHTLVQCRLKTGRTHQIRVHMAHIGFPLEGDPLYAKALRRADKALDAALEPFLAQGRQALHARRLQFKHPQKNQQVRFEAPLPDDFEALIDDLGLHAEPYAAELERVSAGRQTPGFSEEFVAQYGSEFFVDEE